MFIPITPHKALHNLQGANPAQDGNHANLGILSVETRDPTVSDGERMSSVWVNSVTGNIFIPTHIESGASLWIDISQGASGGLPPSDISKPSLVSPSAGVVSPKSTLVGSPYEATTSKLLFAEFQVSEYVDFHVSETFVSTVVRTSVVLNSTSGTLYVRVRYVSDMHAASEWSDVLVVELASILPTLEIPEVTGEFPSVYIPFNQVGFETLGALVVTEVQISSSNLFENPYSQRVSAQESAFLKVLTPLTGGEWFIRGRSWASTGPTDWSATQTFEVGLPSTKVLPPVGKISTLETLRSLPFESFQGSQHLASRWRISTLENMTGIMYDSGWNTHVLEAMEVPTGLLMGSTVYFVDCQHKSTLSEHTRSVSQRVETGATLYADIKLKTFWISASAGGEDPTHIPLSLLGGSKVLVGVSANYGDSSKTSHALVISEDFGVLKTLRNTSVHSSVDYPSSDIGVYSVNGDFENCWSFPYHRHILRQGIYKEGYSIIASQYEGQLQVHLLNSTEIASKILLPEGSPSSASVSHQAGLFPYDDGFLWLHTTLPTDTISFSGRIFSTLTGFTNSPQGYTPTTVFSFQLGFNLSHFGVNMVHGDNGFLYIAACENPETELRDSGYSTLGFYIMKIEIASGDILWIRRAGSQTTGSMVVSGITTSDSEVILTIISGSSLADAQATGQTPTIRVLKLDKITGALNRNVLLRRTQEFDANINNFGLVRVGDYVWFKCVEPSFHVARFHISLDPVNYQQDGNTLQIYDLDPNEYPLYWETIPTSEVTVHMDLEAPTITGPHASGLDGLVMQGFSGGISSREQDKIKSFVVAN